ncbi:hypothetical protein M3M33_17305, partial [Loigolactobacillus coryniformis]|uniref:hypothetical protein n=1 Tax=Loigolactobacillus coryniformis TaxID=1610 RepID=UPI00201ADE33
MGDIAIVVGAGWDAMAKNSHLFFASVKGGIKEIGNLAGVAKAGLVGAAGGVWDKSLGAMRGAMDWLDANDGNGTASP